MPYICNIIHGIVGQLGNVNDLILFIGHCDIFSCFSEFELFLLCIEIQIMVLSDAVNDLIVFIGHCDPHFVACPAVLLYMYFCNILPNSPILSDGFASYLG